MRPDEPKEKLEHAPQRTRTRQTIENSAARMRRLKSKYFLALSCFSIPKSKQVRIRAAELAARLFHKGHTCKIVFTNEQGRGYFFLLPSKSSAKNDDGDDDNIVVGDNAAAGALLLVSFLFYFWVY